MRALDRKMIQMLYVMVNEADARTIPAAALHSELATMLANREADIDGVNAVLDQLPATLYPCRAYDPARAHTFLAWLKSRT